MASSNGIFMKNIFIILFIAVVHSVLTKFVSMVTLSVVTANVNETQMSFIGRLMMMLSKVLYFPVITMAWYPRQFFPGNFVVIPLFVNSLLWAFVIYALFMLIKRNFTAG
jgi:hypothetical protein